MRGMHLFLVSSFFFTCVHAQEPYRLLWMKGIAAARQAIIPNQQPAFQSLLSVIQLITTTISKRTALLMTGKTDSALIDFLSAEKRKNGVASYEIARCYALLNRPAESADC